MLRSLGALLMLALVAGTEARAGDGNTRIAVTATVLETVTLVTVGSPTPLTVSEAEIRRGYKDVSVRYLIKSNGGSGYVLRLAPRLGLAKEIEVGGLSNPLVLGDREIEVYRPRAAQEVELVLDYRIVLAACVRPGSYESPVYVAATPL